MNRKELKFLKKILKKGINAKNNVKGYRTQEKAYRQLVEDMQKEIEELKKKII